MWKYFVCTGLLVGIFVYITYENAEIVELEQDKSALKFSNNTKRKTKNLASVSSEVKPSSTNKNETSHILKDSENQDRKHHPLLGPLAEHRPLPENRFKRNELLYNERHVFLQTNDRPDLQKSPLYNFNEVESYLGRTFQGEIDFIDSYLPSLAIELTAIITEKELLRSASSRHHHQVLTDIAISDKDNSFWRRSILRDPTETNPGRVHIGGVFYPDDVPPNLSISISKRIFPEPHAQYFETIVSKIFPNETLPKISELREMKASFDLDDIRTASALSGKLFLGLGYSSNGRLHKLWMSTKEVGFVRLELVK